MSMSMEIVPENISRKVDSLGRVSIPSGLRSRFGIEAGDEINFGTCGKYICVSKADSVDMSKYLICEEILKELGEEVPQKLQEILGNNW